MTKALDLLHQRFGRLLVIERRSANAHSKSMWLCRCDCGALSVIMGLSLVRGVTSSCGCLSREVAAQRCRDRAVHGKRNSPEYSIWVDMHRRCCDPTRDAYPRYGGRGITVCERWKKFENFYADMGPRPTPTHSLDRINNNGNYEPENCRWATLLQQANNRLTSKFVTYHGQSLSLANAIRSAGSKVRKDTVRRRLKSGWSIERAVETPPDQRFNNQPQGSA